MRKSSLLAYMITFMLLLYKYLIMWKFIDEKIGKYIIFGVFIFIVIKIFNSTISRKALIKVCILLVTSVFIYYVSNAIDMIVALAIALLYSSEEDSDEKFIRCFLYSTILLYGMTLLLYFSGFLDGNNSQRFVNGVAIVRNSLGFTHVNSVFIYYLPILLSFIYLGSKKNKKTIILLDILSCILFYYSGSRTGFMVIILANVLLLFKYRFFDIKVMKFIVKNSYIILPFILYFLYTKYGNDMTNFLNTQLSFRPYYAFIAIRDYGLTLFGTTISPKIFLDCAYLTYLIGYGIIALFVFHIIHSISFKNFSHNYDKLIVLCCFLVAQIFENDFVYCTNFILSLQFIYILKNDLSINIFKKRKGIKNEISISNNSNI